MTITSSADLLVGRVLTAYENAELNSSSDVNYLRHTSYEPRRQKTGPRGFRPGLTQIGLYSNRSRLET